MHPVVFRLHKVVLQAFSKYILDHQDIDMDRAVLQQV